ncbi:MAG: LysE family translocator [Verrucomicrobia bacterium]|nr:MAG: LysE family translocator [Verrucomicrobiota bacterium]
MFGIHHYESFVGAIVVFQMIPGPGTLTILKATARHGVRSGMGAVLGTLTGDLLFMLGAVLGLAAVLAARPLVLSGLQWVGIAYLCWLGLKLICAPAAGASTEAASAVNGWTCFRQAFAVCLTNPKAIMFFMAFFPLFLAAGSGPYTLGVMMAHVTLISLLYQTALVFVGHTVAVSLSRFQQAGLWARRLAGIGLLGFGLKLAVNRK